MSRIPLLVLAWLLASVGAVLAQPSPEVPDSLRADLPVVARDSSVAASDSLAGQPPLVRGVADTVTVLPEVTVERERGLVPDRSTTTSVRMDRS